MLKEATWVWTEFFGKIKGCPFWTKSAIALHRRIPRAQLIHEHAVPKAVVIDILLDMKRPTHTAVRRLLTRLLAGVVVTPEEDAKLRKYRAKMPDDFWTKANGKKTYRNKWLRYKECGIEVIHQTSN